VVCYAVWTASEETFFLFLLSRFLWVVWDFAYVFVFLGERSFHLSVLGYGCIFRPFCFLTTSVLLWVHRGVTGSSNPTVLLLPCRLGESSMSRGGLLWWSLVGRGSIMVRLCVLRFVLAGECIYWETVGHYLYQSSFVFCFWYSIINCPLDWSNKN